jgi:hypothetical protein
MLLAPAPAAAQRIAGTVVEADTRRPVVAALVQQLAAGPDSIIASAVTDAAGRFRFGRITPGRYRIRILRIGFKP